ncbi:MAG TPA: hypothetical protein VF767_05315, partial [Bryobacteraceae bacterium]
AAWQSVYRHADWLGLDWCRVELEQRMYEPERGRFDWDNPEMRILYRILDWAESRRVHVFLQQMWGNTKWNALPELRDDPEKRVKSAPLSLDDFADGFAEMVNHLVKVRGYRSIQWLSINNEPGQDFSWWQGAGLQPLSVTPGIAAARKALDRRGIGIPLSGPDWTDMPALEPKKIGFDAWIGAYDIHSYYANFDGGKDGYPLSTMIERMGQWVQWAHERNKPFFLSEVGSMVFGWGKDHPGPGSYEAGLKDAALVVRAINAGADGFNRWSLINRGDLDGQWQLIDTWDRQARKLRSSFTPHPNAYYLWGLLSRYTALDSDVLPSRVDGGRIDGVERLASTALRSPKGEFTVIVVNEAAVDMSTELAFDQLTRPAKFYRYRMTPALRDRADVELGPGAGFEIDSEHPSFRDGVPARSVTVYSTYKLLSADKGVQAE